MTGSGTTSVHGRARVGDVVVRGGRLADGTGAPLRDADLLLDQGRVAAVTEPGVVPDDGNRRVVDASGLVVAPGFIDVHAHADNAPLLSDDDTSKVRQGVTTEVVGNCGFSLAPLHPGRAQHLQALARRIFPPVDWRWQTFAELLAATDAAGYVTNYVPLVGHGALRVAVAGVEDRALSSDEESSMARLLLEALDAGAFGLSTGLIYPPGVFSSTDELVNLARHLPSGRFYATHMRGEGAPLQSSVAEALEIGRRSGCAVHLSHLKSSGRPHWGGVPAALAQVDAAAAEGLRVTQDVYPYTASSTMLTACLPPWFQDGGEVAVLDRLQDERALARARADVERSGGTDWDNHVAGAGWDGVLVASTASHADEGRTLAELADEQSAEPFDVLVGLLRRERLRASMVVFSMDEGDVEAALRHGRTTIGSDGLPPGTGGKPHPRLFGTFPRVLGRYVRERGTLGLEEAVHRMTGLAASVVGLPDRGEVRADAVADLVAFDPGTVDGASDYRDPVQEPSGIAWVMQGGEVVVADGRWLGTRRGTRLRPR